jgi:methylated-DNA-[protein]-cysteine S-methyltransferase
MSLRRSRHPDNPRAYYSSPLGTIEITGDRQGLIALRFVSKKPPSGLRIHPALKRAVVELDEYFRGKRKKFGLKPVLRGTEFQVSVWRRLIGIPYGETRSYREVAKAIGRPKAVRAVGAANAANAVGIIIPCHRVIGSDGKLVGYGSGLWRKKWLLVHERGQTKGVR